MRTLLAFCFILLLASCKKEEDTSAIPTWTIEGKTITAQVFLLGTNDVRWFDVADPTNAAKVNFVTVEFSRTLPQVAGTYDIGGTGTTNTYIKTINVVNDGNTSSVQPFLFDGSSKVGTASLTVNNGRRFLTFSNITLKKLNASGQQIGTATLSVNLLEF
jgi:hypothetical protein